MQVVLPVPVSPGAGKFSISDIASVWHTSVDANEPMANNPTLLNFIVFGMDVIDNGRISRNNSIIIKWF
jgi:hypothetical protein